MNPADAVTWAALIAGSVCFILYVWLAASTARTKPAAAANDMMSKAVPAMSKAVSVDEFTKLIESISKLTDSLGKAGPSLTSLVGSILFFTVAAISSGALHGAPPPDKGAKQEQAQQKTAPAKAADNQAASETNTAHVTN